MKSIRSAAILLAISFGGNLLASDPALVKDIEALRNSLPLKDSARPTLTLRLADVLFDQAVELAGNPTATEAELKKAASDRKRSLILYQEALNGTQFHPAAQGALAYKIKFQLARLQQDLGQAEAANKYWKELVEQQELQDLRREASLRLAEYYEKLKTPAALRESDTYYKLSIELCGEGDVCAYGHYRRAWALREADRLPEAIDEMQVALFDSKGQVREEALRDLIVFLSLEKNDGEKALLLVEKLAGQTNRPNLYEELAESFYSNGNRAAGTRVLETVNQRTPTLAFQIRLLEEEYGLRNWEKFRAVLEQAARSPLPEGGLDAKSEKILRRLSVQLDGERASRKEFTNDFQSVVLLYMQLFPKDKDRFKMMEGWMVAEADPAAKMKKIDEWVSSPDSGLDLAQQIKLRETRLALAVKGKDSAIIETEAAKLATLVKDPHRVNEYRYIQSVALKEQGKSDEALALLKTWALPAGPQDTWTFRGGLLMIDILVEKKDNKGLAETSNAWLESPTVQAASKGAKEKKIWDDGISLMTRVREESLFENAAALGESPEALSFFEKSCMAKKFLPKSCENARVLAVKLKKQDSLLALLKTMERGQELIAEYEAAGFFGESAELQEKDLNAKSEDAQILKVALLYELANRYADRNRLLTDLTKKIRARKSMGDQEQVIWTTLKDAKMLGPEVYDLPWSPDNRLRLANQLELEGKGNAKTKADLMASTKAAGVAWSRYILEDIAKLDTAQRKVTFYGRQGQTKFKNRLKVIGNLDAAAEKFFGGSDTKTRVRIAALVGKAYTDFSNEILSSPLPEGLSPEVLAEAKASLAAMAEPFQKKAADYQKLAKDQLADITAPQERAAFEALLLPEADTTLIVKVESPPPAPVPAEVSDASYKKALDVLHADPSSSTALTEIKSFYDSQGKERLASYFQGRLIQLGNGG